MYLTSHVITNKGTLCSCLDLKKKRGVVSKPPTWLLTSVFTCIDSVRLVNCFWSNFELMSLNHNALYPYLVLLCDTTPLVCRRAIDPVRLRNGPAGLVKIDYEWMNEWMNACGINPRPCLGLASSQSTSHVDCHLSVQWPTHMSHGYHVCCGLIDRKDWTDRKASTTPLFHHSWGLAQVWCFID